MYNYWRGWWGYWTLVECCVDLVTFRCCDYHLIPVLAVLAVLGLRTAAGSFFWQVWTRISFFCRWPFDCCCCCCCRGQERDVPRLNWRHPDGRGHFHASHSAGATFILTFLFFFFISSSSFVRNERFIPSRFVVANDLHISRPWRHSTSNVLS